MPRLIVFLAALLLAAAAQAEPREQRGAAPGSHDFYVLAMSWSPGFCATSRRGAESEQCAPDNGNSFVLHGLWPQFETGYPTECDSRRSPPRSAVAAAVPPYPTEGLARYQWRKHGSCSGLDPARYYSEAAAAFRRVIQPPELLAEEEAPGRLTPLEIERAFAEANRGLRPEMMAVQCNRGSFTEIRICMERDLKGFRACREVDRDACRAGRIRIEPVDRP